MKELNIIEEGLESLLLFENYYPAKRILQCFAKFLDIEDQTEEIV